IRDLIVTGVQTCALPIFADRCFHAEFPGAVPTDWSALGGTLPARECHIYTIAGTVGRKYITGAHGVGLAIDPELVIATDASFRSDRKSTRLNSSHDQIPY